MTIRPQCGLQKEFPMWRPKPMQVDNSQWVKQHGGWQRASDPS
jgi:hypothetical protein